MLAAVYSYNSKSVRFTSHFDRDSWQRSHSQWQQLISKQSTVIVRRACAVNKQHLAMISGGGGSLVWKENRSSETHFHYYVTCISKCQKTKSGINKFSEPEWLYYLHNVTLPSVPTYFIDLYRFLCREGWVLLIMIMNFSTFFDFFKNTKVLSKEYLICFFLYYDQNSEWYNQNFGLIKHSLEVNSCPNWSWIVYLAKILKMDNSSVLLKFTCPLRTDHQLNVLCIKHFCFSLIFDKIWWCCSTLCVLQILQVSLNSDEKEKSFMYNRVAQNAWCL